MYESIRALRKDYEDCTRCPLCKHRKNIVWSTGPEDASILIVGDMPGEVEDASGIPFDQQSPAGIMLSMMLLDVKLTREDVRITTLVLCRPTVEGGETRNPSKPEIDACGNRLRQEILLVDPDYVIIMGHPAARALLDTNSKMESLEGKLHAIEIPFEGHTAQYVAMVMYNPGTLSRTDSAWAPNGPSRRMTDLMRRVHEASKFINLLRESPELALDLREAPGCGPDVSVTESLR